MTFDQTTVTVINKELERVCIKHYLPLFILRTLYNSLFLSHCVYGILSWGSQYISGI